MITPADVAWAICAGADFVTSARGFMFAIGCIQSLKCNKNTCPTGITTHNKRLQKGLNIQNKALKVNNYIGNMVKTVETIAHSCGVKEVHGLNHTHVRIVQMNGKSTPMNELYPTCSEGEN
jgi:glutamate synthase domain-containing protein 2